MRLAVFVISLLLALVMLGLERGLGIGWDYHPDSVTYATTSIDVANLILARDPLSAFNNGYYLWVALLGMNVGLVTAGNMLMFALTNTLLFTYQRRNADLLVGRPVLASLCFILLATNPYRLHLATTMLKDSMIILLTVFIALRPWRRGALLVPILALIRIPAVMYLALKFDRRQLAWLLLVAVLASTAFSDQLTQLLLDRNGADMRLRDFDRIPNFQDYGLIAAFLRATTWPFLAVTGAFAVLSPAAAFVPVAIASVMTQLYCVLTTRRFAFPLSVFVVMAVFATLVTGFTAYIRYVYPLMAVLPMLALQDSAQKRSQQRGLVEGLVRRPA